MWCALCPGILFGILFYSLPFAVLGTELPFCSGRSQLVSSSNRLVLDGSNSQLYNSISVAAQPGTTCKCSIVPTALVQTMTVTMKSSLNIEFCSKNLRIVLPESYYYDTVDCTPQTFTMENVGLRTVDISLGLLNMELDMTRMNETYKVSVGSTTKTADLQLRVTCYSPTIGVSTTSRKPTTSPSLVVTSSTMSATSTSSVGSTTTTVADQTETGDSKTVLIVCLIVACGVLMLSSVICILCFLARRVTEKEVEKHQQRSPRRIYRRICQTIRTLPGSLNLRRPLPPPPESSVKVTKIRTRVSALDSGPYDSIKSSVKSIETTLNGTTNGHLDSSQNEYGYIYPIYDKEKRNKNISPLAIEDPGKYLTPLQNRAVTNHTNTEETTTLDSDYVNAVLSVGTENVSNGDSKANNVTLDEATGQYMEMWNAKKRRNETQPFSDTDMPKIDKTGTESPMSCRNNNKGNVLQHQPTQDLYVEMDGAGTDENKTIERDNFPNETSVITNSDVINDITKLKRQSTQDTYVDMENGVLNELCDITEESSIVNNTNKDFQGKESKNVTDSKAALKRESTQDVYIEMDNSYENKPGTNSPVKNNEKTGIHNIHSNTSTDVDYVTLNEIGNNENEERKGSVKDKTFPNLMKFHVASIKPKLRISRKRPPPVKPKPVKYVREMLVDK